MSGPGQARWGTTNVQAGATQMGHDISGDSNVIAHPGLTARPHRRQSAADKTLTLHRARADNEEGCAAVRARTSEERSS